MTLNLFSRILAKDKVLPVPLCRFWKNLSGPFARFACNPSLYFSPDVTDSAPQIGFHKGFSEGVAYRALPTEEHPLWDQRSSGIGHIG